MNAHPSTLRAAALLLALGSALACSAILKPRDKVTRCGSQDDCASIADKRYTPVCKFDDAHANLDTTKYSKICVAEYRTSINCDPTAVTNPEDPFKKAVDACGDLGCDMGMEGTLGCPPLNGMCTQGTVTMFNDVEFCGDDDVVPGFALQDDLEAQHVKDAVCKSFFCEDNFVCNNNTHKCVPCDPDADYGAGGCGTVYANGAPAPVYLLGDDLTSMCAGEHVELTDPPIFGGGCGE